LGGEQELDAARLINAYTHLYDTNFADVDGIKTHYVVLAYELENSMDLQLLPKSQHMSWKWVFARDQDSVHRNVVPYFQSSG
jgi:colanic acid biosynthesis protein WcaH